MSILVVDAEEASATAVTAALAESGYTTVERFRSAFAALEVLGVGRQSAAPAEANLAIIAAELPGMDGIEAVARIRSDRRHAELPIVMLVDQHMRRHVPQALMAGVTDIASRPVDALELMTRVRASLRLRGEQRRRDALERELAALRRGESSAEQPAPLVGELLDRETGIFARPALDQVLRELSRTGVRETTAFLAVEMDRLDAYRHHYGDAEAAAAINEVMLAAARSSASLDSIIARAEPDVMALICRGFDRDGAAVLAEAIRAQVADRAIPTTEAAHADVVTVSIGMSVVVPGDGSGPRRGMAAAIRAVERAIGEGGNTILFEAPETDI